MAARSPWRAAVAGGGGAIILMEAQMDPQAQAFQTVCICAGQIRGAIDNPEAFKSLPVEVQAYVTLGRVYVERFLEDAKKDGRSIEPLLEAVLIHSMALQGKCDELLEE